MRLIRPAWADWNDAALLRAISAGDAEALAVLYDRHAGWLHARLSRRCSDAETVAEVLQDTFVSTWRSAGARHRGPAGGWLWVIASRRLVDALRSQARAAGVQMVHASAEPATAQAAPSAEERVLSDGLEYSDTGTALDRLSPELREVLRATVIDGLTTREAADLLGIPEGTVKTRARRARRELREALALLGETGPRPIGGSA